MRVCVRVCAWVRVCAPHLANISKIVQDATRAGTQAPERPPANTGTQATTTSTRAGATTTGTQRTRIAKEIKKTIANKIFFNFFVPTFAT